MDDIQLSWCVGLLEGEGSFGFSRKLPRIQLGMTDEDVVRKFHELVGFGSVHERGYSQHHRENWKRYYVWNSTGKKAKEFMTLLLPYMGERRQARIREILESC